MLPVTIEEYRSLREAVGWGSPPPEATRPALERTMVWAVERDAEGRLLGLARAVGDGMYVLVVDVMVDPTAQQRGVGRRLLATLAGNDAVRGARHATLLAGPDVAGFYHRLGLEEVPGTAFRLANTPARSLDRSGTDAPDPRRAPASAE